MLETNINSTAVDSDIAYDYVDDNGMNAQEIAEQIFKDYCVEGVLVMQNSKVLIIKQLENPNNSFTQGRVWKILMWSRENFCEK